MPAADYRELPTELTIQGLAPLVFICQLFMSTSEGTTKGRTAAWLVRTCGKLPLPLAQVVGSQLGRVCWYLPTEMKRVTKQNIDICWPHLGESARGRLAKRSFLESFITAMEMPSLWMQPFDRNRKYVKEIVGEPVLDKALSSEHGVILIIPHQGNWEFCNHFMAAKSDVIALYQPAKIPEIDQIMAECRSQARTSVVPTNLRGIRTLLTHLKSGGCTAILPDQEPEPSGGVFSPFFGVSALSTTLVTKLIKQTKATPIILSAQRIGVGKGFRIIIKDCPEQLTDPDTQTSVDSLNRVTEELICSFPEQYQWSYKRFKRRPEGSPKIYN